MIATVRKKIERRLKRDRREISSIGYMPEDMLSWGRIWRVSKVVFWSADTTTVRIILANASVLWALTLIFVPYTFGRPVYRVMADFFNWTGHSQWAWAALYLIHGIGVYWRLYDPFSRPYWGIAVNLLGFLLWTTSTLALNVSIGYISPTAALEWTLCLASAWALLRTGLGDEVVSP